MSAPLPVESAAPLLSSRLTSSLAALPGLGRLTSVAQPYMEAYGIPARVANLETYARARVNALNDSPVVSTVSQRAASLLGKIHETQTAVTDRVTSAGSSALSAVESGKQTVYDAAASTKARVVLSLETRKSQAVELAKTTAASLVTTVTSHPLASKALTAAQLAESKICGAISLASDLSEVALDRILAPEDDESQTVVQDTEAEESVPVLGQASSEVLVRIQGLSRKVCTRVVTKASRTGTSVASATSSVAAHTRERIVCFLLVFALVDLCRLR
jgi:hypothetical protein